LAWDPFSNIKAPERVVLGMDPAVNGMERRANFLDKTARMT
jgi:hypothetical protein